MAKSSQIGEEKQTKYSAVSIFCINFLIIHLFNRFCFVFWTNTTSVILFLECEHIQPVTLVLLLSTDVA